MAKNKFYAVKELDGQPVNKILNSWSACSKLVKGKKNPKYKSFDTMTESRAYLAQEVNTVSVMFDVDAQVYDKFSKVAEESGQDINKLIQHLMIFYYMTEGK